MSRGRPGASISYVHLGANVELVIQSPHTVTAHRHSTPSWHIVMSVTAINDARVERSEGRESMAARAAGSGEAVADVETGPLAARDIVCVVDLAHRPRAILRQRVAARCASVPTGSEMERERELEIEIEIGGATIESVTEFFSGYTLECSPKPKPRTAVFGRADARGTELCADNASQITRGTPGRRGGGRRAELRSVHTRSCSVRSIVHQNKI